MTKQKKLHRWIAVISVMMISGCVFPEGKFPEEPTPVPTGQENQTMTPIPQEKQGYVFRYNDTELAIDAPAKEILTALGEWQTYFEAPSCAVEGMIRTYGYGSFELDTYEKNGEEFISCIYFKDDTVTTAEGAFLFMPQEALFAIYGTEYTQENGFLVYRNGKMQLKILLSDNEVTSIQYCSKETDIH